MKLYANHFSQCSIINHQNSDISTSNIKIEDILENKEILMLNTPVQTLSYAIGLDPVV